MGSVEKDSTAEMVYRKATLLFQGSAVEPHAEFARPIVTKRVYLQVHPCHYDIVWIERFRRFAECRHFPRCSSKFPLWTTLLRVRGEGVPGLQSGYIVGVVVGYAQTVLVISLPVGRNGRNGMSGRPCSVCPMRSIGHISLFDLQTSESIVRFSGVKIAFTQFCILQLYCCPNGVTR